MFTSRSAKSADPARDGPPASAPAAGGQRPPWSSVFGVAEFRGLWAASVLSMLGDQLARVALTVLVFNRTGSALLAGLALAVTLLPGLLGGSLLSGLADRYPRREVMIWCNLLSVGLVVLMATPGLPLLILFALVFALVMLDAPFMAARATLISEVFPDDRYTLAQVVNNLTFQGSQVFGYGVGGAVVATIGPGPALLVNAVTFAVAAALVRLASPRRPAADSSSAGDARVRWTVRMSAGARLVFRTPQLRQLVLLSWLATFWVVPEGLAAPWAAALGGTATTVGLLMAAGPVGTVIGAIVVGWLMAPALRQRLMLPLAATAGVPMLLCAFGPPLPVILALLAVAGFGSSYQLAANTTFMQAVPNSSRAQALGLVMAGLTFGQGLGLLAAGALAERLPPQMVVAGAGAVGLLALLVIAAAPARASTTAARPAVG